MGDKTGFFIEYLNYQDYVYSRSKKTELGDAVEIDMALRYQFNPNTFGRIRFETDPAENRGANKTSKFEFLAGHKVAGWDLQLDAEIRGDDTTGKDRNGETSVGLDLDSELTHITYDWGGAYFTFFPFNFDGEVGSEFKTPDVNKVYFVEGAPSSVNDLQVADERIGEKTIPGIELGYNIGGRATAEQTDPNQPSDPGEARVGSTGLRVYVGGGAVSYLYPSNSNFTLPTSPAADRWERREDLGYKAGILYRNPDFRFEAKYVGHTESEETGSLYEAAASVYAIARLGKLLVEPEVAYSKAGKRAYNLDQTGEWFDQITPFQPIYADYRGKLQDWLGKQDYAYGLRIGYETDTFVPYISYKHQDPYYIFRDRESAHMLRTADDSKSHGGLERFGVGAYFYSGSFLVNPNVEFLYARNAVFTNSSDVRQDRILSSFRREDAILKLTVSYSFGPSRVFRP